jgi:4-hydroxybenzoyl-CoA reductase beta subunit
LSRPESLQEALELLKTHGSEAKVLAGGTDLLPRMKYRLTRPKVLISLKRAPVDSPCLAASDNLELHALMPLAQVVRSSMIRERAPLLIEAAESVGSNQIRHMATLGGNLCLETRCWYFNQSHTFQFVEPCFKRHGDLCYLVPKGKRCWALFVADTAPALICLNASVEIISADNRRSLPVEDLYTGDPVSPLALSPGEILSGITIPKATVPTGSAFVKFTLRGGVDFAIMSISAVLGATQDGLACASARIVVGGVGSGPMRARKAEAALMGQPLARDLFPEVAKIVALEVKPRPRPDFTASYLKKCLETQTLDALTRAWQRIALHEGSRPGL